MLHMTWTDSAIYCLDTGRDCGNCTNSLYESLRVKCHMPEAVKVLLSHNIPMPGALKRIEANDRVSINSQANAWIAGQQVAAC